MAGGERLPEQDADGPDVGRGRGGLPVEALGRDVRQRPGHVALRGQRLRLLELRQAEVGQPRVDALPVLEQDVRGLHVAVDDPVRVRMRETVEHLCGNLDGLAVVE